MSCRYVYWYVFSKIFLKHLRVVFKLSCLEEDVLRCPKVILKTRLRIVTWNLKLKFRAYKLRNNCFPYMSEIYQWKYRRIKTLTIPWVLNFCMVCSIINYPHCICKAAYYIFKICLLSLRFETVHFTKFFIRMLHWKISITLNDLYNVEWYVLLWMISTVLNDLCNAFEWHLLCWMI